MVTWNGTSLKSKGIIVEEAPNQTKAKRNYTAYTVEGRNGSLIIDNGTYTTFNLSLKCHFNEDNYNINEIKAFLDGYGKLSLDGVKEYTAMVNNSISFEKVVNFRKFTIQFLCQPIAKKISSSSWDITSSPSTQTIGGTYQNEPEIKITGASGDVEITVNDNIFYLNDADGDYTLDCENKVIVDSNGKNASSTMNGDFPVLNPGENTISYTGTITSMAITYHETYI